MANYLCIFSAPDEHIEFMEKYPGSVFSYCEGEAPEFSELELDPPSFIAKVLGRKQAITEDTMKSELPSDWPKEEPTVFGPEVNHRNVDLYHRILNNTPEPVVGSGSIFQTWFHKSHSAVSLDGEIGENFAFKSTQLPSLLDLIKTVTVGSLQTQFAEWCIEWNRNHSPEAEECEEMLDDFRSLIPGLEAAIENSRGIVWVTS